MHMRYFVVFNVRGVVQYEKGDTPEYLNSLIRTIDLNKPSGQRRVQDCLTQYQIVGNRVYLSIGDREPLEQRVSLIESLLSRLPENQKITEADIEEHARGQEKAKSSDCLSTNQTKICKKKEALDFSSGGEIIEYMEPSSAASSIAKFEFKKAFRMFFGSIDVADLGNQMKTHLMKKNMEASYAALLADTVLSECKEERKSRISENEFREKLKHAICRLIPLMDHDKLIENIRNSSGIFVICFVGINGVGKSTSLAKVARWLLEQHLKVYVAACDTFRAGAVEQLKVHVERFRKGGHKVGFHESGYGKDDASVAHAAIMRATRESYDVVLIDTAGRMHNKENMMRSLANLVRVNEPNYIIFVGEALVGSDSLKHIKEFNSKIMSTGGGRKINSILLTKADTVDDKIGQVVNLSFSASAPIIFLGVGQTNSDLVKMDPETIAELLAS